MNKMKTFLFCLILVMVGVVNWFLASPRVTRAELEAQYAAKARPTATPEQELLGVHYNLLHTGLTIAECNQRLGIVGREVSRGGEGQYETIMMSWVNRNGSNITATFQGGRLLAKSQFGLQ